MDDLRVRRLALLGVPSSLGAYAPGQEDPPRALREAGLVSALEGRGVVVEDLGDLAMRRWAPDATDRYAQNVGGVTEVVREAATRIAAAPTPLRSRPAIVTPGELNPHHDAADGATLRRFVAAFAGALVG